MKWYSKDGHKMIDLDAVQGYVYIPAKEFTEQNPDSKDVEDFNTFGNRLEIILGGTPYVFRGDQSKEIFNLLDTHNNKQLLEE